MRDLIKKILNESDDLDWIRDVSPEPQTLGELMSSRTLNRGDIIHLVGEIHSGVTERGSIYSDDIMIKYVGTEGNNILVNHLGPEDVNSFLGVYDVEEEYFMMPQDMDTLNVVSVNGGINESTDELSWMDEVPIGKLDDHHLSKIVVPPTKITLEDYILDQFDSRFITIVRDDNTIVDILCDNGSVEVQYYNDFDEYSSDMAEEFIDEEGFLAHFRGDTRNMLPYYPELYDLFLRFYPNTKTIYFTIY